MKLNFHSPAIFVEDMARSRAFYVDLLGLPVCMDHGLHLTLADNSLSLWQRESAESVIYGQAQAAGTNRPRFELYFEAEDLDRFASTLEKQGIPFLNPLAEMPWGQMALRVLDPDGHIVEVAEPLSATIRRMHSAGKSVEELAQLFSQSPEKIQSSLSMKP